MQRTRTSLILSGIAAALLVLAAPPAGAQDQPQTATTEFSQQQLEAFAGAAMEVQRVQEELQAQAQNVEGQDEVARLQQEAQVDASKAVEDSGLSVDEYTAIAQAATEDPELYAMIIDLMKERSTQ